MAPAREREKHIDKCRGQRTLDAQFLSPRGPLLTFACKRNSLTKHLWQMVALSMKKANGRLHHHLLGTLFSGNGTSSIVFFLM